MILTVCLLATGPSAAASVRAPLEPAHAADEVRTETGAEPAPVETPEADAPVHGLTGDWGGWRTRLEERGITFTGSIVFDAHRIASGGVERESLGHTLFDASLAFDLDVLFGLHDAVLVADAYIVHGRNASDSAGDFQSFSNISTDNVEQLAQLYYEQYFHDQTWRVKLGKADANTDFGAPDSGGEFIHSASAFSPTTFTLATYPNPATAVIAFWQPNESWYVGAGAYDGAANAGVATGSNGPSTFFGAPQDLFYVAECGYRWTRGADELAGRASFGLWHHSGEFARFTGGNEHGTDGVYGLFDQELARYATDAEPNTLAGFVRFGLADGDVATADVHVGAGITRSGFGARADDGCGAYVSWVHFSDDAGLGDSSETACELYYKRQIAPWLVLKPDIQYIANPGGDSALDDAIVLSLRAQLDF